MGLFDFFKGKQPQQDEDSTEKYWSLSTYTGEVIDPTLEEIITAVQEVKPDNEIFATLAYNNSRLEIESIQTIGDATGYRFEALDSNEIIYVNDGLTYEETLQLFKDFYNYQRVPGFRSWPTETY